MKYYILLLNVKLQMFRISVCISNDPTLSTLHNSQFSLNIYITEALEKKYQTLFFSSQKQFVIIIFCTVLFCIVYLVSTNASVKLSIPM